MTDFPHVLTATLRDWRRSPFAWGIADCLISAADYAGEITGTDPSAPWRGTYTTEAEAMALVEAAGGAVALFGGALAAVGIMAVETAERGDCIVARVGSHEVGGICVGDRLAFRLANRGLVEINKHLVPVLGAWRP